MKQHIREEGQSLKAILEGCNAVGKTINTEKEVKL
jgi:hypothetical protein